MNGFANYNTHFSWYHYIKIVSWCYLNPINHYNDVIMGAMTFKSPASRLFTQAFIQAQIKENIKAPRHWPLWGEFACEFPAQRTSNKENVSIWWRHHYWVRMGNNDINRRCHHIFASLWYHLFAGGYIPFNISSKYWPAGRLVGRTLYSIDIAEDTSRCTIQHEYGLKHICKRFTLCILLNVGLAFFVGISRGVSHHSDVIMTDMASQIAGVSSVCSNIYSSTDQRKHQSFAPLASLRGIHRWTVVPLTKSQWRGKCFLWWRHHGYIFRDEYLKNV